MSISAPFIERPRATSLLALGLVLLGVTAYRHLSVAPLPRLDMPAIYVSVSLPGANPVTMASAVTTPLERRLGRIAGVNEITSSSDAGSTGISLLFDLDRDINGAARDVQAAINAASADLPAHLPARPRYHKFNPADAPILILGMTSKTLLPAAMFEVANSMVAQRISQVDGVGQVYIGGAQQPAVRVQVDPSALAARGLTLKDVRRVITAANVNLPKGVLQGEGRATVITANDQLTLPADYGALILSPGGAAPLRLRDVAEVQMGVENSRQAAWLDGQDAVVMVVRRQPNANVIETIDRVRAILPQLRASISPAIELTVALDRAATIRASVHEVEFSLVLSVFLVIAVVFYFLRSPRATCIPSVAVPLSLLGTFAAMYTLDYSLNNLTLMALTIATGFVVDDAIVVTENIMRHVEAGMPPRTAALRGAEEIGFTIVSITLSLIAVFLPILLLDGLVGRMLREFSITLVIAIVVSAVVSLTVTPSMCAHLLRAEVQRVRPPSWLERTYARGLGWALGHRRTMLGLTAVTLAVTVVLFVRAPKGLFPQQDTGLIIGFAEGPEDIAFSSMRERQRQVQTIVDADPDVEHVISFMGSSGGGSSNTGTFFLGLRPFAERASSAEVIVARLRRQLRAVDGIALYLQAAQDMRIGGRSARTQFQYTLQDADLAQLNAWAPRVKAALAALPELRDVASDQQMGGLELFLRLDRDAAARLGVTARDVDDVLDDAYGQRIVSTIYNPINQNRVILEVNRAMLQGPEQLGQLHVAGSGGVPVPLAQITQQEVRRASLSVSHQEQFAAITLSFNLAPQVALGEATRAVTTAVEGLHLPAGLHADFAGTAQAFGPSSRSQPLLLLAALVTVYIVLGVLYESLRHPLTILSTLPAAGIGALLALEICGMPLDVIGLIGIILLIGIVKKNAIMVVDFALEGRRHRALTALDAIHEACLLRFRPIMMTTVAALIAALPLALGQGPGSELRRPLGVAIIGGLLLSQLLTLFTTPVVYLALEPRGKTTK